MNWGKYNLGFLSNREIWGFGSTKGSLNGLSDQIEFFFFFFYFIYLYILFIRKVNFIFVSVIFTRVNHINGTYGLSDITDLVYEIIIFL